MSMILVVFRHTWGILDRLDTGPRSRSGGDRVFDADWCPRMGDGALFEPRGQFEP